MKNRERHISFSFYFHNPKSASDLNPGLHQTREPIISSKYLDYKLLASRLNPETDIGYVRFIPVEMNFFIWKIVSMAKLDVFLWRRCGDLRLK